MTRTAPILRPLDPRLTPTAEVEPNDTYATANFVAVTPGDVLAGAWTSVTGILTTPNDTDIFRVNLTAASAFFADLDTAGTPDTVLDIFDATGQNLFASNDQGYDFRGFTPPAVGTPGAPANDPAVIVDLPAGDYAVRVRAYNAAGVGSYTLRLLVDPTTTVAPPALASLPGAPHTVHLDFDGHAATDDFGTYIAAAYDLTGNPTLWTPAERLAAYHLWRVVADDFAPLNVNITTTAPAAFGDGDFRVVLTSSSPTIINRPTTSTTAVTVGSLTTPAANVGFVFAGNFGDYLGGVSGRAVAAPLELAGASSYVVARAAGLKHYGAANSQPGGLLQVPDTGLNRETWRAGSTHSGEPPVVAQNDLNLLAAQFGWRPDDHGDTPATATVLTGALPQSIGGVIGDPANDRDVIRFHADALGTVFIRGTVDNFAGNADLKLRVLDAAGKVLAFNDPPQTFNAFVGASLPGAGDYFLEVSASAAPGQAGAYLLQFEYQNLPLPPRVGSVTINGGGVQRSFVTEAVVTFDSEVNLPTKLADAFVLSRNGPGLPVGPVALTAQLVSAGPQTAVRLTFGGPLTDGGSLTDGAYTLLVLAGQVTDNFGQQLDGNADFLPGGDHVAAVHRLFGDLDGDRKVSFVDFLAFRNAFGTVLGKPEYQPLFDFDADGVIGFEDFLAFRARFGVAV